MIWVICFFAALIVFTAAIALFVKASRKGQGTSVLMKPINLLFAGVSIAGIFVFIPIYASHQHEGGILVTLFLSAHHMLRLFVIDGEMTFLVDSLRGIPQWLTVPYTVLSALLFICAPLVTFGFVLSFTKNVAAMRKYIRKYNSEMYIFSELNAKSVVLGESIAQKHKKALFVYCGVDNAKESELVFRVSGFGAVCFTKEITLVRLRIHSKKAHIYIFEIGDDTSLNVDQSYRLVKEYGDRPNTDLYVVSSQSKAEALLAYFSDQGMHLHRVSEVRSFLYHSLYNDGYCLFKDAVCAEDGVKDIGAVFIGLGKHGFETARTLTWFCQMDGYRIRIHAFDREPDASERFAMQCPELIDEAHNGNFTDDGEAQYRIDIIGGVDYESDRLLTAVKEIGTITYTFIDTGDDAVNTQLAMRMRVLYERMHIHPRIFSVLHNSDEKEMLSDICDYSGNRYDIQFIADVRSCYSEEAILNSELEKAALQRHLKWGEEKAFWMYEHNYKSSMASALHTKMKRLCGITGANLSPAERSEEDALRYRKLEHRRWNAYMRSEGFIYSGSIEKSSRNNLGKMHNCLVTYDLLPEAEKLKDDN